MSLSLPKLAAHGRVLWLLAGAIVLFYVLPETARNCSWTNNVLRNWEQFGFLNLQARLVQNPGGVGVFENPQVYLGHRAASLYPGFVVGHLFGGAGEYFLPFYLLLSLLVIVSIRGLLEYPYPGFLFAALVVFSPGYLRTATALDPLGVVVMLGFPVTFWLSQLLRVERLRAGHVALLVLLTAAFAALNWTCVFVFALLLAWLAKSRPGGFRRLTGFTALVFLCVVAVSVISVMDKAQGHESESLAARIRPFYNGYLFGPTGYDGAPMNWSKALARLVTANLVGLLPLVLFFAYVLGRAWKQFDTAVFGTVGTVAIAAAMVLGLRNYFAHHPWMAAPVLTLGMLLSLQSLLQLAAKQKVTLLEPPQKAVTLAIIGSFAYGILLAFMLRVNSIEQNNFITFVRGHTARQTIIHIPEGDVWLVQNSPRLTAMLDRVIAIQSNGTATVRGDHVLTTKLAEQHGRLVAQSDNEKSWAVRLAELPLEWYRKTIVRRRVGDRLEMPPTYYLYRTD